jgi:Cu/Ag efflux pump CusA
MLTSMDEQEIRTGNNWHTQLLNSPQIFAEAEERLNEILATLPADVNVTIEY